MGFNYKRYLASREWAVLKRLVAERSFGWCERHAAGCKGRPGPTPRASQVHHLTYERIGHETLEDLLHVCEDCHEYLSAATDVDPVRPDHIPVGWPIYLPNAERYVTWWECRDCGAMLGSQEKPYCACCSEADKQRIFPGWKRAQKNPVGLQALRG